MESLTSIIIPTYNRYILIGATLDSIIAQTYPYWECIVVDDGSTDYTAELLECYCKKDDRIKFYQRPINRKKGANACRNFGFEKSTGNYIQWFDSDDLMVPDFLKVKVASIEKHDVDFVVSKTINFKDPNPEDIINRNERYYRFKGFDITNFNYVSQNINWLTPDFLGRRELCEKVRFNECLKSAQERNYFSLLTCYSTNIKLIDEYLTKRRVHQESIRGKIDNKKFIEQSEYLYWETWLDLSKINPQSTSEEFLFSRAMKLDEQRWPKVIQLQKAFTLLKRQKRTKVFLLLLGYKLVFVQTGKGFFLRKHLIKAFYG